MFVACYTLQMDAAKLTADERAEDLRTFFDDLAEEFPFVRSADGAHGA